MKIYFIIFSLLLCTSLVNAYITNCSQENANSSSTGDGNCGLNYTGNYTISGSWTSPDMAYDKNWSSSTQCASLPCYITINYTRPSNVTNNATVWTTLSINTSNYHAYKLNASCEINPISLQVGYVIGCFSGDTKIKTLFGDKKIKNIKIGDFVLSYDFLSKQNTYSEVSETFIHDSDSHLLINNNLEVTSNHPMYINNKWMEIGNAHPLDKLKTDRGEVFIFSIQNINNNMKVYNLEVENTHNYYANDYLVHNKAQNKFTYSCFNTTNGWNQLGNDSSTSAYFYEEGINWSLANINSCNILNNSINLVACSDNCTFNTTYINSSFVLTSAYGNGNIYFTGNLTTNYIAIQKGCNIYQTQGAIKYSASGI